MNPAAADAPRYEVPAGGDWLHESSYRMHAWLDNGKNQPLTRTGLDG